jgi:hypothetical protein
MRTIRTGGQSINTCLHRPHWNASVSACWSAAPSDKNKLSSSIFASAALRSSEAMSYEGLPEGVGHTPKAGNDERTWLVILANVCAGISPAVTLRRKPGLFLSLRFTNNVRILDLYVAVVPLQSLHAVSSTARARCNMRSEAADYVSNADWLGYGGHNIRKPDSSARAS